MWNSSLSMAVNLLQTEGRKRCKMNPGWSQYGLGKSAKTWEREWVSRIHKSFEFVHVNNWNKSTTRICNFLIYYGNADDKTRSVAVSIKTSLKNPPSKLGIFEMVWITVVNKGPNTCLKHLVLLISFFLKITCLSCLLVESENLVWDSIPGKKKAEWKQKHSCGMCDRSHLRTQQLLAGFKSP